MAWPYLWKKINFVFLFSFFIVAAITATAKDLQPHIKFETVEITVGKKKIQVEIAKEPAQHQKGLMYRTSLGKNKGMLFIFPQEEPLSFWMKNTYIDLSIAYIDKNFKIVDIQEMKATSPLDITEPPSYPSKKPAKYALEMEKGWFKKSNIKVGQKITIPEKLK